MSESIPAADIAEPHRVREHQPVGSSRPYSWTLYVDHQPLAITSDAEIADRYDRIVLALNALVEPEEELLPEEQEAVNPLGPEFVSLMSLPWPSSAAQEPLAEADAGPSAYGALPSPQEGAERFWVCARCETPLVSGQRWRCCAEHALGNRWMQVCTGCVRILHPDRYRRPEPTPEEMTPNGEAHLGFCQVLFGEPCTCRAVDRVVVSADGSRAYAGSAFDMERENATYRATFAPWPLEQMRALHSRLDRTYTASGGQWLCTGPDGCGAVVASRHLHDHYCPAADYRIPTTDTCCEESR